MVLFSIVICVGLYALPVTHQEAPSTSLTPPLRQPTTGVISLIKQIRPKTHKRSPINHQFITPLQGRILTNKKPPANVLHYVNHYIYCDNLDQHALDQIKSGSFSSDKQIQHFNLHHGFDGLTPTLDSLDTSGLNHFKTETYMGDKEIHILHLPKDKPNHNFDEVKLHLSLLNAHSSAEVPQIDLDLNKNFGSFEVNLDTVRPPILDSSLLPTLPHSTLSNDVVKPLLQGHISSGQPTKYNINWDHFSHYLNNEDSIDKDVLFKQHSNEDEEILDLPHFEQHPLEHDPSKSSYDSPGAVDSYGHPVTSSYINEDNNFSNTGPNLASLIPNEHLEELSSLKAKEFYVNQLNEIHDLQRKRRQERMEKKKEDDDNHHPNHRYD